MDGPQSRVGAHVLGVARVPGIHLYDVPVVGTEGSRQKGEAEEPTDARGDH